jgi:hypothetical protein
MLPPRGWLLLASFLLSGNAALVAVGCESDTCTCNEVTNSRQPGCWWASTGSFRVCSFTSPEEANQVARRCENLRTELAEVYGLESHKTKWQPRCEVYLLCNKQKYGAVVGRAAMETLGSTLVTPETGLIKVRRIDLRTDVVGYLQEVLPHEMTHVLIADQFREGPPPLWYDEGLALLADSPSKHAAHVIDLRNGLNRGIAFSLEELMTTKQYPTPNRVSVFYGQCASLAQFLANYQGAAKVHAFARQSQAVGVNLALKETYGIRGVSELEQMWLKSLETQAVTIPARGSLNPLADLARSEGKVRPSAAGPVVLRDR